MHEYYKDEWTTILLDKEKGILKFVWHDDGTLTAQKYKELLLLAKEIVIKYRPTKNLSDARYFKLVISPELQIWIAENIFHKKGQEILKQYAFVVPHGIFTQVSVEQMMEESDRETMTRYFYDIEEAERWLGL